ncbi:MAG: hypothetical protein RMK74_12040 [Myxococcales bacterium]|nr:hypothetical protein [Myxococcales bacterium]
MVRTLEVDRRDVTLAVWEKGENAGVEFPSQWQAASSLSAGHVSRLLKSSTWAVLVVGRTEVSMRLLEHSLENAPSTCRLYVYAPRELERDAALRGLVRERSTHVLTRWGFDTPADWLVVGGNREGILVVGPAGGERRWIVPVDGRLGDTLCAAARILFWFHAEREGLPGVDGRLVFGQPLRAPFEDPGRGVRLPSGYLAIDEPLPDEVQDAEIRIVHDGIAARRAKLVFLEPNPGDFARAKAWSAGASRVVWVDTGLPCTAVSQKRLVMDMVEGRLGLQLEWPASDAIQLLHCLRKAAQKPAWAFEPRRRLGDIVQPVILEQESGELEVKEVQDVDAPDVVVPLKDFEHMTVPDFGGSVPLAKRIRYRWRAIPEAVPAGARTADLARRWERVDEWARHEVDTLRRALEK